MFPKPILHAVFAALAVLFVLPIGVAVAQSDENHEADYQDVPSDLPKPSGAGIDLDQAADEVFKAINEIRERRDLRELERNSDLAKAAGDFAEFMADTHRYGHTADGRRPSRRAEAAGYAFCAVRENIAYQYRSEGVGIRELVKALVDGWMESPGHRKNILGVYSVDTGVAIARSDKTGAWFAVQMFGRPQSESVRFRISNETDSAVSYRLTVEKVSDAARTFEIGPGMVRVHERCRPVEVNVSGADRSEAIPMKDGTRLRLLPSQGEAFKLEVEQGNGNGEDRSEASD